MALLSIRDLTVEYHNRGRSLRAVRSVNLDVERGEVLGLVGESGSGKSTLGHAVLRLLPPDAVASGKVVMNGENVLEMDPHRLRTKRWREASIVFQGAMHSLNPVRSVGDQIAEAILVHAVEPSRREAMERVQSLLESVGVPAERSRSYPHELSGGQRQRVMIAMALACEPALVIADEAVTALDVMVQAQVVDLLKGLQERLGLTMIFITHDLALLSEIADRVGIMYAGTIVEEGPTRAVLQSPAHPYTRGLAAACPRIGDDRDRMAPSGLKGDPPDPQVLGEGCSFAPRCSIVGAACFRDEPVLTWVGPDRRAACFMCTQEIRARG